MNSEDCGNLNDKNSRFSSILEIFKDELKKHREFCIGDGISLIFLSLKASDGQREVWFELLEHKNR